MQECAANFYLQTLTGECMLDRMLFPRWLLFFSLPFAIQAATDPWVGTWRMDKAKSHFENFDGIKDGKVDITSEGNKYRLAFSMTNKDGKTEQTVQTQPKDGGKVSVESGNYPGQADMSTVVEVPDDHHWIYKHSKNGKVIFTRYVTLSADGRVHEVKATRMQDGKKVVEDEYMVKVD